jgi:hypothetical protein
MLKAISVILILVPGLTFFIDANSLGTIYDNAIERTVYKIITMPFWIKCISIAVGAIILLIQSASKYRSYDDD